MRTHFLLICLVMILCLILPGGCRKWRWTDFEYVNRSDDAVTFSVLGMEPDPSPSRLLPGDGTDALSEVTAHLGEVISFDDIIKIIWTVNDDPDEKEQHFKIRDLKISSKVSGGRIRIIYTSAGDWEVKYLR